MNQLPKAAIVRRIAMEYAPARGRQWSCLPSVQVIL